MATVNFILQGKGGVGKSLAASLLAQYYLARDNNVICVDTDPVNATLASYKGLNVSRIELMENNQIKQNGFDDLMELITNAPEDAQIIVDNGASSFVPFSAYLIDNQAIPLLTEMGHTIYVHTILTGGQALADTITGFVALTNQFPEPSKIVVWLNQYFGNVANNENKPFDKMKVYIENKSRVAAIIEISKQSEMFDNDVKNMLSQKLTFNEVQTDPNFNFMAKNRLKIFKEKIFNKLDSINQSI